MPFIRPKQVSGSLSGKIRQIQVMILDSTPQVAELYNNIFKKLGFSKIIMANNGTEGVQMLKKKPVDIILTDWELKVYKRHSEEKESLLAEEEFISLSGVRFVERLRRSEASPNPFVPVIMMVEQEAKDELQSIRDVGVNEIIRKPLNVEELTKRIISVIDHPRMFVTAPTYKGPCRRRHKKDLPENMEDRRKQDLRVIKQVRI